MNKVYTETGYKIFFAKGNFDSWCVYVKYLPSKSDLWVPLDREYFLWIRNLANKYGYDEVYNDFKRVYEDVDEDFNPERCLFVCMEIDKNYQEDTSYWWIIFYMTMVAECKKKNTKLKKRIKNLGVYNILFDKWDIDYVTTYMRNKGWRELDILMKERGI